MIVPGPTRIVLLRAGKYDFADVELDRAVHLVAENNVGKTTLIAALQFLYIDRANVMDFSKDLNATRRYYFPDTYSYVLFECLTPKGHQVLGVHGQGPVQSYQYERFRYTGEFSLDDYVDEERRPRRWEDVAARLATRDFSLVQPQSLPGVLTGLGGKSSRGSSFGIVPVRQRNGYDRFRRLFTHLLKLGKLRQEDLKREVIETWEPDLRQREVDLEGGFRSQFEEVRRQREQVGGLQTLLPHIDRAVEGVEARDEQRAVLPSLWASLQNRASEAIDKMTRGIEEAIDEHTQQTNQAGTSREEAKKHRDLHVQHRERVAAIETKLEQLDGQAERFKGYQPEFEDAAIEQVSEEIGDLEYQLRSARTENLEEVLSALDQARRDLQQTRTRLQELSRLVVTEARKHLDDAVLAQAFQVLNPELLGVVLGEDGVEILDRQSVLHTLRSMARREPDGHARLGSVRIAGSALPEVDIGRYADRDSLQRQLDRLEKRTRELEALEQTLRQEQPLKDKLAKKRKDQERRLATRAAYETFLEASIERPQLVAERDERQQRADEAKDASERAEEQARGLEAAAREARQRADRLRDQLGELRNELSSLSPPHWPHEPPPDVPGDGDLGTLVREYRSRSRKEEDADSEIQAALREIERIAYDQYTGGDQRETVNNLREARDALPEQQEALDELWRSLIVELRSAFKGLGDDLDTLDARLKELNVSLRRISVSNLDRVALRIEQNRELGKYIQDVQRQEVAPLFASRSDANLALERIGDLLRQRPKIRLEDMFDLHFEVTPPDGVPRRYAHLDKIESNGTTVTIKVLVSLHLLRALLTSADVRIPFFLDEVASLDRNNQRAIVEAARELGFCPILASPEAGDAADVLYYLREDANGRIVLDPDSAARVEIRRPSAG